jgi:hypothetical protein
MLEVKFMRSYIANMSSSQPATVFPNARQPEYIHDVAGAIYDLKVHHRTDLDVVASRELAEACPAVPENH